MKDDQFYDALAHPARRSVLALLRTDREISAGAIAERLDMNKPTLSGHLTVLKNSGLVIAQRSGIRVFYRLDADRFRREIIALLDLVDPAVIDDFPGRQMSTTTTARKDGGNP